MRQTSSIGFSIRLQAFISKHMRRQRDYLRNVHQLAYGEFAMLYAMLDAGAPLAVEPLAEFLMLKTRTVRQMLLAMEDRGLVAKRSDPGDNRRMVSSLTEAGEAAVRSAAYECFLRFEKPLWRNLAEAEFEEVLGSDMRSCVNHIRGRAVEPFEDGARAKASPVPVDHFVFWRVVTDRWAQAVREECGLSLNAFCLLRCLYEQGALHPSEAADMMLIPRSALSACKQELEGRGLIAEHGGRLDRRGVVLSCTQEGADAARRVFVPLDEMTRDFHSAMDEEGAAVVNAWYARMFVNMWKSGGPE